jgi:hypothetical protein
MSYPDDCHFSYITKMKKKKKKKKHWCAPAFFFIGESSPKRKTQD